MPLPRQKLGNKTADAYVATHISTHRKDTHYEIHTRLGMRQMRQRAAREMLAAWLHMLNLSWTGRPARRRQQVK
jgi:hypothetical protein